MDENDEVLISGFGRRGKAKGDIPGVRFKIVKVSGVGLLALWKEKKVSVRPISFHGRWHAGSPRDSMRNFIIVPTFLLVLVVVCKTPILVWISH